MADNETTFAVAIAWTSGKTYHGRFVETGGEVERELRRIATQSWDRIHAADTMRRHYDPDANQEPGEVLQVAVDETVDIGMIDCIANFAALPSATEEDLKAHRHQACYAVILGDGDDRKIFVRKTNPVQLASKSVISSFMNGALVKVSGPLLAFDGGFDVIYHSSGLYALSQRHFEGLFKDSEVIRARAGVWVDQIFETLPVSDEGLGYLKERVAEGLLLRNRIHSILKKSHVQSMTIDRFRQSLYQHGLSESDYIVDGKLTISKANERELLQILNESYYYGEFTGTPYSADNKRERGKK